MYEIGPERYSRAQHLFSDQVRNLAIQAALAGTNPGRIFVNNVDNPTVAFAQTVEESILAGDHADDAAVQSLQRFLREQVFSGEVSVVDDDCMMLTVESGGWADRLPELIPTHEAEPVTRYYYTCEQLDLDWRERLPDGYEVRRIDRAFLDDSTIACSDAIRDWFDIEEMWHTVDNFLTNGVGFAVVKDGEIVAQCTADCRYKDWLDIGIITHPEHRGRGLASAVVAATVDHCLRSGIHVVGWHCDEANVASWRTAESVGFQRSQAYTAYYYIYELADHLAELGWYHYRHADYAKTVGYYEDVFRQRASNPGYFYYVAASAYAHLGDRENAARLLLAALDAGWRDADRLRDREFAIVQDSPAWEAILERAG